MPDFAGGEPIRLADGEDWFFPVVGARIETRIGPAGPAPVAVWVVGDGPTEPTFEDQFQEAIDSFLASPPELKASQPMIDIGTVLLQRNYRLTVEECDWLIYRGFWELARTDGRPMLRFGELWAAILRLGLEQPSEASAKLTRDLPRHQATRFDVGAN